MTTREILQKTKAAWPSVRSAKAEEKNRLLLAMADALEEIDSLTAAVLWYSKEYRAFRSIES